LGDRFKEKKGVFTMRCVSCGAITSFGTTPDVTDLGSCLIIIRNVPCYKCSECNEIIYTADVVKHLEKIAETAELTINEISIIDYRSTAA
jgi:YgiT-type zinc finger domain-containing protein